MKSRKTGKPMSLYVVNILPWEKLEVIYNINEFYYIRVTIKRFKVSDIGKQCRSCQKYTDYRLNALNIPMTSSHQIETKLGR